MKTANMMIGQELQVIVEKMDFHICPVKSCTKAFLDANCLTDHAKHHEKMFHDHMSSSFVEIERVKIFQCDNCRQCFLSKNKFFLHKLIHINKSHLNTNRNEKIGVNGKVKPYKCSECEYEFVAKSTLEAHSICHQPFPHICHCGVGYYQLEDLKSHKKLVHPVQKTENTKPINNGIKNLSHTNSNKKTHGPILKAELKFRQTLPPLDVDFKRINNGKYQCGDCMKSFCSKISAQKHYRALHRGERPYICHVCGKGFSQSSGRSKHLLIHAGSRDYKCQYCPKPFRTFHSRQLHERTHTGVKPYQCTYCEKAFSDPSAFQRHTRIHTGDKKYVCPHCPKAFTDNSALYVHRKRHGLERNHACKKCGQKFYTKADARKHYEVVHEYKYNYQCDHCKKTFSTKENLRNHIKLIHSINQKTYNCNLCLKIFKQEHYLKIHMKNVHEMQKKHTCEVCFRQFFNKCKLKEHIAMHSGVKKFECAYCFEKFYMKSHIRCHIIRQHLKNVSCAICKRKFISMSDYKRHKLKISDRCDICGQTFICRGEKSVHHNKVHTLTTEPKRRYECDYCGRVFTKYYLIKRHILEMHSIPKFICDYCGKRFALKDSIRSHMWNHLDFLSCNICYKRFYSTLDFKHHKRTGCTLTKYNCDKCDKSFMRYSSLRDHLLVHMKNRKKYKCPICSRELLYKASVIRHIKLMHNKMRLKNYKRS